MHRVGRGVMRQAGQAVIHALRREGRKRGRPVGITGQRAVHDVVVRRRKVRHVEDIAEREVHHSVLRDGNAGVHRDGEVHRDRRVRGADLHGDAVVPDQKIDLLDQVVAEKVGPGDRGGIGSRAGDMPEGKPRVDLVEAGHGQPDLGVEGADPPARMPLGDGRLILLDQKAGRQGIEFFKAINSGGGIREALGLGCGGGQSVELRVVLHGWSCD